MVDLIVKILINAAGAVRRRQAPALEPADFNWGNDWWKLIAVALVFALVNSYIKPIVKALSMPIGLLTLGLVAFVINAAMLLLTALAVRPAQARLQGRRLPAELHLRRDRRRPRSARSSSASSRRSPASRSRRGS